MTRRVTPLPSLVLLGALSLVLALAPVGGAATADAPSDLEVSVPHEVNLAAPGLLPVTVTSRAGFDATTLEVDALEVSAGEARVAVAREDDGTAVTRLADTDGDGRTDLIVFVDKEELVEVGGLGPDTTQLTVTAATAAGTEVSGSDRLRPTVSLELKLEPAALTASTADRDGDGDADVDGDDVPLRRLQAEGRGAVASTLAGASARVADLFDGDTLDRLEQRAEDVGEDVLATAAQDAGTDDPVAELAAWYQVTLPADTDVDAVLAALETDPDVAHVYPSPEPVPPPQVQTDTPDFTHLQGYQRPAPEGIDADFSRQDPRTRGAGITIANLEYDWTHTHEDLLLTDYETDLGGGQFLRYPNFGPDHGTAVFGQLIALDNDYGVTGGVPDAVMYGISPTRAPNYSWQPGPALAFLASQGVLEPGDVVLLEQQAASPLGGTRYAPLEWIPSVFDANVVLASQGVNVVSTGGNGNTATDDPMYTRGGEPWFDRSIRDSGAIYVGAGSSTTQERLSFSNYGPRFDLQAWGQNITTTGYCTLYCITGDPNVRYTRSFSGTSGAGPIVTTAVVAVQSYLQATGQPPMSAPEVAEVLQRTGTPQGPTTAHQHIGPMPDLRAALRAIEVDPPETEATITAANDGAPPQRRLVRPIVTLDADDGWGSGVERTEYRIDGSPWRTYDGPIRVDGNGLRTVQYRSIDANGNVEDIRSVTFHALGRHARGGR